MFSNPFHYNRPIEPESFVGRWPLVHTIAADLARLDGDSYAIVGGRRFGKSSLLLALNHQLIEQLKATEPEGPYVLPLTIDFKALELDSHHHLFAQVIENLRWVLNPRRSPRHRGPHLPLELAGAPLDGLYPPGRPPASLNFFRRAIGVVIDQAFDTYGELRLVLLIDEIEEALGRPWTETLFNQLRSLIYSGSLVDSLRLVIAGDDRVLKMRAQGSPLLNMLEPQYLTALKEVDVRTIIARAPSVATDVADAVVQQCGGHPYLAQSIMHQIWERGVDQTTADDVREIVHRMTVTRRPILENWYEAIGSEGRAAFAVLAAAPDDAWLSEEEIKSQVLDHSLSVTEGLINLYYHGFVVHQGSWRRYRRSGELFWDWFLEEHRRGSAGQQIYLTRLRRLLTGRFSESELQTLCFDLGVDYENLAGDTKADKARTLVTHLSDRERIDDLVSVGKRLRPDIPW